MPKYLFEIDVGGVRMDSYGSVWTRMGPYGPWGPLQGFPGPEPVKNIAKNVGFGFFWGWGPPLGPVGCLVAYVGPHLYGLMACFWY